jgi:hypothetical protein
VRRMVVNEVVSLRRRRWSREVVRENTDPLRSGTVEVGPEDGVVDGKDMATALASFTLAAADALTTKVRKSGR